MTVGVFLDLGHPINLFVPLISLQSFAFKIII